MLFPDRLSRDRDKYVEQCAACVVAGLVRL